VGTSSRFFQDGIWYCKLHFTLQPLTFSDTLPGNEKPRYYIKQRRENIGQLSDFLSDLFSQRAMKHGRYFKCGDGKWRLRWAILDITGIWAVWALIEPGEADMVGFEMREMKENDRQQPRAKANEIICGLSFFGRCVVLGLSARTLYNLQIW
jgi:hypothetical protein